MYKKIYKNFNKPKEEQIFVEQKNLDPKADQTQRKERANISGAKGLSKAGRCLCGAGGVCDGRGLCEAARRQRGIFIFIFIFLLFFWYKKNTKIYKKNL